MKRRKSVLIITAWMLLAVVLLVSCAGQAPGKTSSPVTESASGSDTESITPDETPSAAQKSETPTETPDETPGVTQSETPTETQTVTPTPGETPGNTPGETLTDTPSATPTVTPTPSDTPGETQTATPVVTPTPTETPVPTPTSGDFVTEGSYSSSYNGKNYTLTVKAESGSYAASASAGMLILTMTEETVLTFSGGYAGGVKVVQNEEQNVEIALSGCTLIATNACPALYFESAKNADISAKKGSENSVIDERAEVEELGSAIYAVCDLKLKGSGELSVTSKNNNGIHTKDDLTVKNLTLSVSSVDNALKGNDSVTVSSGELTLIARRGDGIKTSNTSLSSSGKQKGNISISGGNLKIYAACDGIDAACDVLIENEPEIEIYTDKYSEYSEAVTKVSGKVIYIRATSTSYKYSIRFTNSAGDTVWVNSSSYEEVRSGGGGKGGGTVYYFYPIEKPSGYTTMNVFIYSSSQKQGQSEQYYASSGDGTINESFDTVYYSNGSFRMTNKSSSQSGGGGGPGGGGNKDKGSYSTKGIKAGNKITITGGVINVKAYDDAIHSNNETALESGTAAAGDIEISGGTITVSSNDDGIHADGTVTISGGTINVTSSYEALEGNVINVEGGKTCLVGSDDGVNATSGKKSTAIKVTGGYLDVTVSPSGDTDGIDSNGSYTQTGGIVITRGPNSQMMAALDTESGATITGGTLIILGYGSVRSSGGSVRSISLSLHSKGNHTITVDGVSYTFNNAYSYGKTTCYSSVTVTA